MSKLEQIPQVVLEQALFRTPWDLHVIWTGHAPSIRSGSLRSRALSCIHERAQPVPLRTVMQRAARLEGATGLSPTAVRDAVKLHQQAKPAAYLLVRRTASGDFVAVDDIPYPAGFAQPLRKGQVVAVGREDRTRFC